MADGFNALDPATWQKGASPAPKMSPSATTPEHWGGLDPNVHTGSNPQAPAPKPATPATPQTPVARPPVETSHTAPHAPAAEPAPAAHPPAAPAAASSAHSTPTGSGSPAATVAKVETPAERAARYRQYVKEGRTNDEIRALMNDGEKAAPKIEAEGISGLRKFINKALDYVPSKQAVNGMIEQSLSRGRLYDPAVDVSTYIVDGMKSLGKVVKLGALTQVVVGGYRYLTTDDEIEKAHIRAETELGMGGCEAGALVVGGASAAVTGATGGAGLPVAGLLETGACVYGGIKAAQIGNQALERQILDEMRKNDTNGLLKKVKEYEKNAADVSSTGALPGLEDQRKTLQEFLANAKINHVFPAAKNAQGHDVYPAYDLLQGRIIKATNDAKGRTQ